MDSDRVWKFVKYLAFCVMAILGVVLLVQYISLAQLNNKNANLKQDYNNAQIEYNEKNEYKNNLEENYNQFVEDQSKENNNMKYGDEEVIVGK